MPRLTIFNVYTHLVKQDIMRPMPALSIDLCPKDQKRFATAGGDSKVCMWRLSDAHAEGVEKVADLNGHQRTVNIVRWNSSGETLASAGDDGAIILWAYRPNEAPIKALGDTEVLKEKWTPKQTLRGSFREVTDFCWSPDDSKIINASPGMDRIYVWDLASSKVIQEVRVRDAEYVQGVVWSPNGHHFAAQSTQPHLKLFSRKDQLKYAFELQANLVDIQLGEENKSWTETMQNLSKSNPNSRPGTAKRKSPKSKGSHNYPLYWHNIVRNHTKRPGFSPDAKFLVGSGGMTYRDGREVSAIHVHETSKPKGLITTYWLETQLPVTDIKFNPNIFPLTFKADHQTAIQKHQLKYTMVFAALAESGIYVMDLARKYPLAFFRDSDVHTYTDLSWSKSGLFCLISDNEGFVSRLDFSKDELWAKIPEPEED